MIFFSNFLNKTKLKNNKYTLLMCNSIIIYEIFFGLDKYINICNYA